jgi:cell wall-associated NlpC family hydrolase
MRITGQPRPRLDAILASWEGTPRMAGQRTKGVGTDCAGFVAGVLEELVGYKMGTVPLESAFQTRKTSVASFKLFLDAFPAEVLEDVDIEPGDVLIVGRRTQGLEHALFVGNKYLWHCGHRGVSKTGTTLQGRMIVKKILRYKDKESW